MTEQELRSRIEQFIIDDQAAHDPKIYYDENVLKVVAQNNGNCPCRATPVRCPCPSAWSDLDARGQCRCGLLSREGDSEDG